MAIRTSKEEAISISESDLFELIPLWAEVAPSVSLPSGLSVKEGMDRALELRYAVASGDLLRLDLYDQEVVDVLHAACRSLMDDCVGTPRRTLDEASAIHDLLDDALWPNDELEEKQSLLCSLGFVAWRAARILDLSREASRWEAEYKCAFRHSLFCRAMVDSFETGQSAESVANDGFPNEPESLFQILICLHDRAETDPKGVSIASKAIHRLLESVGPEIAPDLRLFLLAEAAKLAGGALRSVGNNSEVEEWLDKAEKHFRAGVNPRPGLAQVLYLRLIGMYTLGDPEVVVRASPQLEATFTELGMEEDRVKCRILWASSLKVASRLQEALDVLEPVREWRSRIRPSLYAWVLLQSGDIHQNLASYDRALEEFGEAARLFREGRQYIGLADLNSMMSCIYRAQGRLDEALHLLQTSRQDHARLEMTWPEGYHRMLIAETYLAMGRPREAEIEIRAALPILEEQGMLADAVIAVNLLREAVRQRKLDPADTRGSFKPKK